MDGRSHPRSLGIQVGIWAWGIVTAILALSVISALVAAAFSMELDGKFMAGTHRYVAGLYYVLKECGTVIGGVVGFSGLAWAHFFTRTQADPR